MNIIFKKMQYKGAGPILVLNAPESFVSEMDEMKNYGVDMQIQQEKKYRFILCFVSEAADIQKWCAPLSEVLEEDGLFWWAYTKKSSKKYTTDFTRDFGWQPLGDLGFEPVRMVAIDADWSALRFRPVGLIKKLTRAKSMRLTKDR